jgi:hypothetical protein
VSEILTPTGDVGGRPGTLHAGWDFIITRPGEAAEMRCRVCGEPMRARRDVVGPTGWAHAMAIKAGAAQGTPHDELACDHSGEAWHRQALALRMEAARTPSRELEKILSAEAEELVRTRAATKEV